MVQEKVEYVRVPRWYFGGLASGCAACITHPLDLLKVQLQTHKGKNISVFTVAKDVIAKGGFFALYNGISASLLRQMTYSLTRFGVYESLKQTFANPDGNLPFAKSLAIAALGGLSGGMAGNPADLVNVRMQNDIKLPPDKRRNYQHALHGLYKVATTEGVTTLWTGGTMNAVRSVLMTVGQIAFYDQIKLFLLKTSYFDDTVATHFTSSLAAGFIATIMTQPVDVLKTRAMNAATPEDRNILKLLKSTASEGPQAFYKGFLPAFVRLAPHSVLLFLFLEQFRLNFGIIKEVRR